MNLAFAQRCAARILERLSPFAERIEIAGSIRRGRPDVGDIDLVAIPKTRSVPDLFGNPVSVVNVLAAEVRDWVKVKGWKIEKDGPEYLVWNANSIQVDLWFTTPRTFGSVLMCRTGSKEHNVGLAMRALKVGGKWHPHLGLHLGGRLYGESEQEIYTALRIPFLDPKTDRDAPLRF